MDTPLPQKFPFILDRNLAKANCTENRVCTSCDTVVLAFCYYPILSGLTFLPPRIASWRYKRGHRSLVVNMTLGGQSTSDGANAEEEDIEVHPLVEEVLDTLLTGLKHESTVVR